MIFLPAIGLLAVLSGAVSPLLSGPVWLAAIEERAERAATSQGFDLSARDLRTIQRKLDFDEAEPSIALAHLRRFIAESIARHAAAPYSLPVTGCLEETDPTAPLASLSNLSARLAAEPSAQGRRRIMEAAMPQLWRALPPAQYNYLAVSRELHRFDKEIAPGFRSRHEAMLPALTNEARLILNETEPAYRSLLRRLYPEGIDPADLPRIVYASLESSLTPETRQAILLRALRTLQLEDLASHCEQVAAPLFTAHVTPLNPPATVIVAVPAGPGLGALRDLFAGTGEALTYAAVPARASFEARFLAEPAVREAYGAFFSRLLAYGPFLPDVGKLAPEAMADLRLRLAFVDLAEARHLAAAILFEEAIEDPATDALGAYTDLMSRALLAPVTRRMAALSIFELGRDNPIRFEAFLLGSRILKALKTAYGPSFYRDKRALRRLRDGLRRSGFDTREKLRDRFRARREDARTLLDALTAAEHADP